MKVITIEVLRKMIEQLGIEPFLRRLIDVLEQDFSHWDEFNKSPRHASYFDQGVIELMPCSNRQFYSFKYVNGHPKNPQQGKMSVVALGVLADVATGYPLMLSEMTLLTALRTAATAALAAKYLARKESSHLALIGTGAQAEFQALAFSCVCPIKTVSYFDTDAQAMKKFEANMKQSFSSLLPCADVKQAVKDADIVVTATAAKKQVELFEISDLKPGTHVHAMGGDCPGKTEFSKQLLEHARVVVEYLPQTLHEGEVQQLDESATYAELWQLVNGTKSGRVNASELTLFDSVGFALEDFSALRLVYQLTDELGCSESLSLLPELNNPKNLFSLLS
ncbi:MAG: ornithine cyclodeaminase [Gammaproteobacteria bacterium]|nr:ornithine cyclodeaminase [Gammaproteobacteria bacterium]